MQQNHQARSQRSFPYIKKARSPGNEVSTQYNDIATDRFYIVEHLSIKRKHKMLI